MVIDDESRHQAFTAFCNRFELNKNNAFANVAMLEAYRSGGPWLTDVLAYIQGNVDLVCKYLTKHIPDVRMIEPQGTFMVWLDFRELGLDVTALQHFLVHDAHLGLNMGHWFGREGAGFARLNIACPRASLEKALGQLSVAVAALPANAN